MQSWYEKYGTYEEAITGSATGITAFAGGGQASATQLTAKFNNVTVVASNGDSVKLPAALTGSKVYVINTDAAQALDVFPQSGEYIDAVINAASSIGPGGVSRGYICVFTGYWKVF